MGVAVLVSFPVDGELRGVREVALELGQPEASVHRYTRTLQEVGVLRQDPATRRYGRVGYEALGRPGNALRGIRDPLGQSSRA